MTASPCVIRDNATLFSKFQELKRGDIVCCRVRMKPREEHILVDLMERGIRLFPSATSQLASRSKVFQTRLFHSLMIPGTCAVYDIHGLLEAISLCQRTQTEHLVLKQDGKHGGLGIQLFKSPEDIFTLCTNHVIPFPFVLQPFLANCRKDIRVIILGDYLEAYKRCNPDNFRNNLHCGGEACRCELTEVQKLVCRQVMDRGSFPYAHIDLLTTDDAVYLNEINLRGGIRGAAITAERYRELVEKVHDEALIQMSGNTLGC